MTKRTITKWWIWGAVALGVGGLVVLASSLMLVARIVNDQAGKSGAAASNAVSADYVFWTLIAFVVFGGIVAGVGVIAQSVAWCGAIFNAGKLANKSWYKVELWSGIAATALALTWLPVSIAIVLATNQTALWAWYLPGAILAIVIGWCAMIPYLAAAPDAVAIQPQQVVIATAASDGQVRTPTGVTP